MSTDGSHSDPSLVRRVNELYHDLQAAEFNQVHRYRHVVESRFWQKDVSRRLAGDGALFGVDLCTGTGFVPRLLFAMLPSVKILCVDLSANALKQAEAALGDDSRRATFHAGDVCALPLADGSADWVSMNAALHHIPHPEQVLREIDRVLRPGGRFCLGYEPNAAFFDAPIVSGLERLAWNSFWYLSPSRNWARVSRRVRRQSATCLQHDHLDAINQSLLAEGAIAGPLSLHDLRALVDVHVESGAYSQHGRGFAVRQMLTRYLAGYHVETLVFSDYGGEMLQRHLGLRSLYDGTMRRLAPGKGQLFSCILRKPDAVPARGAP
jgi:SAM-dependent methyltransferase